VEGHGELREGNGGVGNGDESGYNPLPRPLPTGEGSWMSRWLMQIVLSGCLVALGNLLARWRIELVNSFIRVGFLTVCPTFQCTFYRLEDTRKTM